MCYEVENLDLHLQSMRRTGGVVVRRPLPAVAFENRRIAWVFTKQRLLLEFLERQGNPDGPRKTAEVSIGSIG